MNTRQVILALAFLLAATCDLVPTHSLAAQTQRVVQGGDGEGRRLGLGLNPQEHRVMLVEPGSLAEQAGLRVYDDVLSVNGRTMAEHGAALGELLGSSEPLVFVVQRGDERLTLTIGEAARSPFEEVALELADVLEARYLFPDRALQYAEALRANVRASHYESVGDPAAFAQRLTEELNAVAEDRHLRVSAPGAPTPGRSMVRRPAGDGAATPDVEAGGRQLRRGPGSPADAMADPVPESGWLTDEIAFMRIGLMPPDDELKAWAADFMEEHAAAKALVLDLRMCRGGTVDMMNGFLPYLYREETHLLNMDMRPGAAPEVAQGLDAAPELRRVDAGDDMMRWQHTVVPSASANNPDIPVYVLTGFTGSACEHLTMALKATGRATVVGGRTGGAGHFATMVELSGGYTLMLPIGRTYDPRTGAGWELVGIEPDVPVDPSVAEARALEMFNEAERRPGHDRF
jgi:C-terminal processing protease CtpA/Prc